MQKIPVGYVMLRHTSGSNLFAFKRENENSVAGVWLDKASTLDAMWQDFRQRICRMAARVYQEQINV